MSDWRQLELPAPNTGCLATLLFAEGALGKARCGWLGRRLGVFWSVIATGAATALFMVATLVLPLGATLVILPLPGSSSMARLRSTTLRSEGHPSPRKTRFRLLAKLCRAGFVNPQGRDERFLCSSHFLLSRAFLTQRHPLSE